MPQSAISYSKQQHVGRIIFNRDTVNIELSQELNEACIDANSDNSVYVVLVSGVDNTFLKGNTTHYVSSSIASIEKPVITAINGFAEGQGIQLALACDIRIASEDTTFSFNSLRVGAIPSDGGSQRLPRIVGKGKALELLLTAATIDAKEALEIGLISKILPQDKLVAEAESMADAMAAKAPIALRYIKEAVNKGLDLTLDQGLRLEADLYFLLHTTSDRVEGITSFQQKKQPRFEGK